MQGRSRWGTVAQGALAGLAGGAVMAAWICASSAFHDRGVAEQLAAAGTTLIGGGALSPAARALYGLGLHAVVSAAFGVVVAPLLPRDSTAAGNAVLGAGYAYVLMGIMTALVVPATTPELPDTMRELGGSWVVGHGLLGAATGFFVLRLRRSRIEDG